MRSSRQKPESARRMISTSGQAKRSLLTIRWTSSRDPAAASIFDGRNRAQTRCSSMKMYNGR